MALDYLTSLGVDIATDVKGILLTHWHKDHIDGASKLLRSCAKAKFYISAALTSSEACYLASLFQRDVFSSTDKEIREFSEIVDYLCDSNDRARIDMVSASHVLFDWRDVTQTRLVAMSPSSQAKLQAVANLKSVAPRPGARRLRNIIPQTPNQNAVALHFSFGDFSAILGADLEETGNLDTGWSAIIQSDLCGSLSLANSAVFKVPHHGSKNGHHDEVWRQLLLPNPISITTPFSRSDLPKKADISRIAKRSSVFWVTRDPEPRKKLKRERMVEREMKAVVTDRRLINDRMGHLQLRVQPAGKIELADNGLPVLYKH